MIALDNCENTLAVLRGDVPPHVVDRGVLERPGFRAKRERWKTNQGKEHDG